jgi:hypothetical protein
VRNNTLLWVLGGLIALFIFGSSAGNSNLPAGCDLVPDPRGGYVDC